MLLDVDSLRARLVWLIRLRWVAIVGVVATVAAASALHRIEQARPLYEWAAVLALANLGFEILGRRKVALETSAEIQVITDLVVLTFLLHYAGGSINPFAFFYVLHVVIASILFAPRIAWEAAALATMLFVGLTAADLMNGEPARVLHPILGQPSQGTQSFALGRLGAFAATMAAAAFLGTTVMRDLRAKQIELVESRERLAQVEKLAAIGQLAAGIAHELNTPLGSILIAAEVTRESEPAGSDNAEMLGDIVREVKRCKEITRSLLDLSRKQPLELASTDAAKVLRQALSLVKRESGARAEAVKVEIPSGLPNVMADAGALGQVVASVVENALDAVEGRRNGQVRLTAGTAEGQVEIRVEDNGPGISEKDLKRIFEPFFTTKESGKGAGLGLSVSYAIMQELRGEIGIKSQVGKGTVVTLRLPLDA